MHKTLLINTGARITEHSDARLSSASAQRNCSIIIDTVRKRAPKSGLALEIASGTGEHAAALASALPKFMVQPSDVDHTKLPSINAWKNHLNLANMKPAMLLDATNPGWSHTVEKVDLLLLINLFHLISEDESKALIDEAANCLNSYGRFFIYGPFKRGAQFTSESDRRFHEKLTAQDPNVGYKSVEAVEAWIRSVGLNLTDRIALPANNLMLVAQKL